MTLVRVDRTTYAGWTYLPYALVRINQFCDGRYATELVGADLVRDVETRFITGSPDLGLWVATDAAGQVVGHMLAAFDPKRKLAFVFQLEFDPRPIPLRLYRKGLAALEEWARSLGARALEATTWHDRLPGFQPHRQIVRRSLDG